MPRAFNNAPSLDHPRHLKSLGTPSPEVRPQLVERHFVKSLRAKGLLQQ